ncbi:alpha/beta fold hydrolase [Mycetocola tolaasinivorans]
MDIVSRRAISKRPGHFRCTEHSFLARSGNDIAYRVAGSIRPKHVYVLCHGLGTSSNYLLLLADHLSRAEDTLVVIYDRAGYRRSRVGTSFPYSIVESVNDLEDLLSNIEELHQSVVLVGHSFGGYIAHRFVEAHPEKVDSLWLIEPTHPQEATLSDQRREGVLAVTESIRMNTLLARAGLGILNDNRPTAKGLSGNPYSHSVESEIPTGRTWRAMKREWDTISALLLDGTIGVRNGEVPTRVITSDDTESSLAVQQELFRQFLEDSQPLDILVGLNHHSVLLSRRGVLAVASRIRGEHDGP